MAGIEKRCFRYLTFKTEDDVVGALELIRPRRWSVAFKDGRFVVFIETRKKEIANM